MTADGLFELTSIPGHLAPTPERLERVLSKQTLEELYEVEEQPFARGKYATVRRCRERSSGRQWAAKFLRKRRRAQELRAEALHEVAVLDAAAHCSRLVSLHQVFETNTEMVLVLELAPGGELQMILDRDEVPEERQVARLLKQILDGIAFLHSLNVAHLDIKPQNLVLTGDFPDCDVKLCDFGISRYISHGADIREILGTPDYVAPEVLNYEPISLATDMWSVGVLLYVLLTGCSPFGGDTKQETFCNISRCRLDFPDDLFEDVSEEARDLMRKLMVKDPSERLTVTECLQHAWFAMFDDPVPPLSPSLPPTEDSTLKSKTISHNNKSSTEENKTTIPSSTPKCCDNDNNVNVRTSNNPNQNEMKTVTTRAMSSHTENIYSTSKSSPKPIRFGLSSDRKDIFKRNMDSLAQKFSSTEIVIIESSCANNNKNTSTTTTTITTNSTMISGNVSTPRRATATHTMPAGEVFKCTPVFILGEEQQCSDGGSDTVSEISTDSSSDRSSIYSDDSLDFILYGKTQGGGGKPSFPFAVVADSTTDRWEQRHHHHHHNPRAWPRECNGVVSKALSRFTSETSSSKSSKLSTTVPPVVRGKTGLEALRERGGNLVVIREPVRAGRYTRYTEVQCESVQARIRRFQVREAS
ncbi:PREDICTED: serine/threonine-protein kinase 17B-like [Polistes canadensis]|uniref:serine/threonine-protein kinase 17B-like n=1 Tax=Polistes canadensis TaxID=91411 RepID=UPI000718F739|nr:PREDICTED: serine/threonine-protein kinase 17B-like [Polistes canadensis]